MMKKTDAKKTWEYYEALTNRAMMIAGMQCALMISVTGIALAFIVHGISSLFD